MTKSSINTNQTELLKIGKKWEGRRGVRGRRGRRCFWNG